ncbi:sodium/glutamate symporter [Psychrobacter aestuarii]|uniref:Sodium/glutamate symporter n=1 Tax=Psychrobacter aestuarii TaxID=556327 RepID=A0ABP3F7G2_9GAMM|nr:sodium/glutamate symporter [Psychrobacter aestuarii]
MEVTLNGYYTLILATLVLLLGRFLIKNVKFLENFNIPEPVAGGLVAAIVVYALNFFWGYSFDFHQGLQTACMLMFFASIGLSADFSRLKAGGSPLLIFTVVVSVFIILQDTVGVVMAKAIGLDPLLGLVTGSIALTGGHGTAGAWGITLEEQYGVAGATTLGIAVATYGLVAGGIIGGPVARKLINGMGIKPSEDNPNPSEVEKLASEQSLYSTKHNEDEAHESRDMFSKPDNIRLITASSTIESLALFAGALAFAELMTMVAEGTWFEMPTFVWALAGGVILRNTLTMVFNFEMFDRAIDVIGNASLSLFLAMALLSLQLWQLTDLALPVLGILLVQTLVMVIYVYLVTFRIMGKDYDAAVLAAGHCGFGMGATPTAIANMQAVTDRYLPSRKAFLIVPMVGAFFVDIVNATVLQIFTQLPFM